MFPHRLEERRSWLNRGFEAAVKYALDSKAHFFLQAGDLFDSPEPRNVERQLVAEALAKLRDAGVRCLGIGGNHDTPRSRIGRGIATPQSTYARLGGLRLLGEYKDGWADGVQRGQAVLRVPDPHIDVEAFTVEGVRLAIGGVAPDLTLPAGSDPLDGLDWQPEADIALLMLHSSLEGHVFPDAAEPIVRRRTVKQLRGIHCLVVGHVHRYATFRWGDKTIVVPGATERMTFADDARPGFAYMEVEPDHPPEVRQVQVECQPRRRLEICTRDLSDVDPSEEIKTRLEQVCDRDAMVRLIVHGPISRQRYHQLKLREVASYGSTHSFFFDLDTTGLYVEDEPVARPEGLKRLSQREELIRFAQERREAASSPEERDLIDEALQAILDEYI